MSITRVPWGRVNSAFGWSPRTTSLRVIRIGDLLPSEKRTVPASFARIPSSVTQA